MASTGESHDRATLHLGVISEQGPELESRSHGVAIGTLPSLDEQRKVYDANYPPRSTDDWVTCILSSKGADPMDERYCRWADDGSHPFRGRTTPRAAHVDSCPHAGSRYVNYVPTPAES